MTQVYLNPYRPEQGDLRALRKLARNYRAEYHQYQYPAELVKDASAGIWIALESRMPTSESVRDFDWATMMRYEQAKDAGLHIVTGSMNHGLPPEVLNMVDYHVYVPQFDDVPFLAPASAAAIALHELFMATAKTTKRVMLG
jgi:tRNA C32,U32 (ribose-2'-O)-methylase TrmJ